MKRTRIYNIVFPNKGINLFVYSIVIFGVISGSLFLILSSETDKTTVIEQITTFFSNVGSNAMNSGLAFKNSLIINYIFVFVIWIFGFSIIGIIINIFLAYFKGFLVGVAISSIFLTYSYKGFIAGILYILSSQLLNIIVVSIISIYSIMFTKHLFRVITSKNAISSRKILKKYSIILLFCIIVSLISSVMEVYLFPNLLKLVISLYV